MIERELSVGSLDNELLLDLLQMTDAAGVLSIYVDAATASIGVHTHTTMAVRGRTQVAASRTAARACSEPS